MDSLSKFHRDFCKRRFHSLFQMRTRCSLHRIDYDNVFDYAANNNQQIIFTSQVECYIVFAYIRRELSQTPTQPQL